MGRDNTKDEIVDEITKIRTERDIYKAMYDDLVKKMMRKVREYDKGNRI